MIYEYECEICGIFEVIQKISDPPLKDCPNCVNCGRLSGQPKKLISLSSFQLIGGGWASDNYQKK